MNWVVYCDVCRGNDELVVDVTLGLYTLSAQTDHTVYTDPSRRRGRSTLIHYIAMGYVERKRSLARAAESPPAQD